MDYVTFIFAIIWFWLIAFLICRPLFRDNNKINRNPIHWGRVDLFLLLIALFCFFAGLYVLIGVITLQLYSPALGYLKGIWNYSATIYPYFNVIALDGRKSSYLLPA